MNSLKIYNTLSRKKEEFTPLNKNSVGMYVVQQFMMSHILVTPDH
jgi:cysteinyl-tRNA synthetase